MSPATTAQSASSSKSSSRVPIGWESDDPPRRGILYSMRKQDSPSAYDRIVSARGVRDYVHKHLTARCLIDGGSIHVSLDLRYGRRMWNGHWGRWKISIRIEVEWRACPHYQHERHVLRRKLKRKVATQQLPYPSSISSAAPNASRPPLHPPLNSSSP